MRRLVPSSKFELAIERRTIDFLSQKYEDRYLSVPELTTRLQERHFLVPDIAVLDRSRPSNGPYPGPRQPVYLCIEILSPPDRFGNVINHTFYTAKRTHPPGRTAPIPFRNP